MAAKTIEEKEKLQVLNDHLADYIEMIQNKVGYLQEYEQTPIHALVEKKISKLLSAVALEEDKDEIIKERDIYKNRFEAEKTKKETAEKQLEEFIEGKVTAELNCEFQKKRNELLKQEIVILKEIYEEKIHELHTQRQQNLIEADASTSELKKVLQEMRQRDNRITLEKQKKMMEDMETQFTKMKHKMMDNLKVYEETVNNKLDLKSEIENYRTLLQKMKARVNSEDSSSPRGPNNTNYSDDSEEEG